MSHKVVAHKVIIRQVTIISYSTVIQIKLDMFRQRNDCKKSSILTFVKKKKQSNTYCKSTVFRYTMSPTPHHKKESLMVTEQLAV